MRQVEEQSSGRIRLAPGHLQFHSGALEEGLIEEVDLSGKSKSFDERRRYYRLTSIGRKLTRAEAEKLADLLRVVVQRTSSGGNMSEKIFACFLRLYPSRSARSTRKKAIQLYSDLYRHEAGLLRKTGLWIGLLTDLALGLPQAYRNTYVSTAASPGGAGSAGNATFSVLEQEPIRPGLFFFGSFLSLALFGVLFFVLNHPDVSRARSVSSASTSPIEAVLEKTQSAHIFRAVRQRNLCKRTTLLWMKDEMRKHGKLILLRPHQGGAETQTAIIQREASSIQLAVEARTHTTRTSSG